MAGFPRLPVFTRLVRTCGSRYGNAPHNSAFLSVGSRVCPTRGGVLGGEPSGTGRIAWEEAYCILRASGGRRSEAPDRRDQARTHPWFYASHDHGLPDRQQCVAQAAQAARRDHGDGLCGRPCAARCACVKVQIERRTTSLIRLGLGPRTLPSSRFRRGPENRNCHYHARCAKARNSQCRLMPQDGIFLRCCASPPDAVTADSSTQAFCRSLKFGHRPVIHLLYEAE